MRFEKLLKVFKSNGYELRDMKSRTKNIGAFVQACDLHEIKIDKNFDKDEYNLCIKELYDHHVALTDANPQKSATERVKEKLDEEAIFADFEKREDGKGSPILRYTNPETGAIYTFGSLDDYNEHKKVTKSLFNYGLATLASWIDTLTPYTAQLKIHSLTEGKAVEYMWDILYSGPAKLKSRKVDPKALPMALEGFGVNADHIIPFNQKFATLDDMHPILKGFLERMENHKYLCAMIASRLLGFRQAYTPYLYGAGGDGKTTFTTFLDKAFLGCTATLELSENAYGLYNCVDKALLFVHDTSLKNVYFYEEVKKISGNDTVKINGKYQHPRDMILPGMIIITSNQLPTTSKEEWYRRRARIFKVVKMPGIVRESKMDTYAASEAMLTSVNEFFNYCVQCLAEVGDMHTGEVNDLPNQAQTIAMSESPDDLYEDFLHDIGYILGADAKIEGRVLRNKISKKAQELGKDKFFTLNFLEYIKKNKDVTKDGNYYYGIGVPLPVMDGHTKFIGKLAS